MELLSKFGKVAVSVYQSIFFSKLCVRVYGSKNMFILTFFMFFSLTHLMINSKILFDIKFFS
jgi:hypothetical protein